MYIYFWSNSIIIRYYFIISYLIPRYNVAALTGETRMQLHHPYKNQYSSDEACEEYICSNGIFSKKKKQLFVNLPERLSSCFTGLLLY